MKTTRRWPPMLNDVLLACDDGQKITALCAFASNDEVTEEIHYYEVLTRSAEIIAKEDTRIPAEVRGEYLQKVECRRRALIAFRHERARRSVV